MNAKQALELKHTRETALVDMEAKLPEGRKSGELSALSAIARQAHKLLTRYDGMETPPAIATSIDTTFAGAIARIDELLSAPVGE